MQITKASDVKRAQDFSMLIFAQAGTGKTTTAKYLPGKTLVIDIDRTTNVLAGEENIDIVYLDTTQPFNAVRVLLKEIHDNHLEKYDNIFFDNISEFENAWFGEKAKESKTKTGLEMGIPQMQDYNAYGYFMTDMIRYINSWEGVNKVFTAWEDTRQIQTSGGQMYNQFVPDIREKILNNVLGLMNVVGRLIINEETGDRGFILAPSSSVFAKNQLDKRKSCLHAELFDIGGE
ncbi:nucleotide-binding protein [Sporosarcina sp. P21c]|uniref:AAA family ATPase n=1 Tax=Sporosarcina sp. P21c TaxID=2048255 RepID=UPI000C163CCD|nr:AAA family ATPase [Sporosarcina sp. P21c]PIC88407.1 nucleotide-binding protein [Sporosarcina sp. P21c]